MRLGPLVHLLSQFRDRWYLAWPMAIGNLAAVWWGYTDYYGAQLRDTPVWLRPFVPDSPNAVLSFAVVLILWQLGRRRYPWLDLLAWIENVKVGLWTVFVLLYYYDAFFADEPLLRWTLFVLHVGMVAQVFALHRDLVARPPPRWVFGALLAFFLVNDWLDYGPFDIHPYLRGPARPVVATATVLLSLLTMAWAASLYARRSQAAPGKR